MASIGSVTVDTMVGAPTAAGNGFETFVRAGSDRIDRTILGKRPSPSPIDTTTLIVAGAAAADTARAARMALKSTLQTVTDAHGTEHSNVFIADVQPLAGRAVRYLGADAIQLVTRWIVEGP